MPNRMRIIEKTIYQVIDKRNRYRSCIWVYGEPLDFISVDRDEAIIYTEEEANKVAEYYTDERNIPVKIESRIYYTKK